MLGQLFTIYVKVKELFTVAKNWSTPKCPLTGNWLKVKTNYGTATQEIPMQSLNPLYCHKTKCIVSCLKKKKNQVACTADSIYVKLWLYRGQNW